MELLTGTKTCWSKQAQGMYRKQNIAKAQRTRGLSSAYQSNLVISQILIKHLQNLDQNFNQTSTFRQNLKILTTTKHQQQNNDRTSP